MYVVTEALQYAQILTEHQNPPLKWSLVNVQANFDPRTWMQDMPQQGMKHVSEVTEWVNTF